MSPEQALQQVLWHYRHIDPSMSVKIEDRDVKAMAECCEFLKIEPMATIAVRNGYTIVALTDQAGNAVVPVENNQADYDAGEKARVRRRLADEALGLANRVKNAALAGEFSSSSVMELADTVLALI